MLTLGLVVIFAAACGDTNSTGPQDELGTANLAVASSDNPNAAAVINDFGCYINLPPEIPYQTTTQSHATVTGKGNTVLTCDFTGNPVPLSRAVIKTGWTCSTQGGFTTNTRAVATPSGNVKITCHINGSI
jgi:hypothetical protein